MFSAAVIDLTADSPLLYHMRAHPRIVGVKRRLVDTDAYYIDLTAVDADDPTPRDDASEIGIAYEETVVETEVEAKSCKPSHINQPSDVIIPGQSHISK